MKNILKRALEVAKELREFYHDSASYVRYNIDGARTSEKERLISRMLLTAHSLEKGMCFEIKKKNWGRPRQKTCYRQFSNMNDMGKMSISLWL